MVMQKIHVLVRFCLGVVAVFSADAGLTGPVNEFRYYNYRLHRSDIVHRDIRDHRQIRIYYV